RTAGLDSAGPDARGLPDRATGHAGPAPGRRAAQPRCVAALRGNAALRHRGRLRVKHVGAVYFEQVNNVIASDHKMISLDRGWASIDGGPARRINSLNELPSGVLWYTNLKNNDFFLAQLHRH